MKNEKRPLITIKSNDDEILIIVHSSFQRNKYSNRIKKINKNCQLLLNISQKFINSNEISEM